jgi:hypothetical protein
MRAGSVYFHAVRPRSSARKDHDVVPSGRGRSLPHLAVYRVDSSHLGQTSFLCPVRSAIKVQLSCVSFSVFLFIRDLFIRACGPDAVSTRCKPPFRIQVAQGPLYNSLRDRGIPFCVQQASRIAEGVGQRASCQPVADEGTDYRLEVKARIPSPLTRLVRFLARQ